jgi:hypothetical protein
MRSKYVTTINHFNNIFKLKYIVICDSSYFSHRSDWLLTLLATCVLGKTLNLFVSTIMHGIYPLPTHPFTREVGLLCSPLN